MAASLLACIMIGTIPTGGHAQSASPADRQKAYEEEQARARAEFFAQSMKIPPSAASNPQGEKNPYAEALTQLMTPPADANQPGGQLVGAYRDYIFVRRCYNSRAEFELIYVTPEELDAAKSQIKAIEGALLQQDASIDKDERWATANRLDQEMQGNLIVRMDPGHQAIARREYTEKGRSTCRSTVTGLRERFEKLYPDAKNLKKDF